MIFSGKKRFSIEMSFTYDEFFSLLIKQKKLCFEKQGNKVLFAFMGKAVELSFGEEGYRKFSSTRIPVLPIDFDLSALGEEERAKFMEIFMLKFYRGGG